MLKRAMLVIGVGFCWLLNTASFVGYLFLRRQMEAAESNSNLLRFQIIRPYRTEMDDSGKVVVGSEADELQLMSRLFAAATEYGNARVVVVTNQGDPGLLKIQKLAAPYKNVQVVEAPAMPPGTASGQMFNHQVGWGVIEPTALEEDILLTCDCDSDLTARLLRQIAQAYTDERVGGVGTFPLYKAAVDLAATPLTMVFNPGMGFLALDAVIRGYSLLPGNLLSSRVSVFRSFGGWDSYSREQQMVDDVATSNKVLASGKQLRQVGWIAVYNRYATWQSWWSRWTRMMTMLRRTAPDKYLLSILPGYGGQLLTTALFLYGAKRRRSWLVLPFVANWGLNILYGGLSGAWRDGLLSPLTALLNMTGWLYALVFRPRQVSWRGLIFDFDTKDAKQDASASKQIPAQS